MIISDHLVKHFGPIKAVQDVSFTVKTGEILGFLGPNGAGKSTTMKMITGFLSPTAGTASIGGHDIRHAPIPAKRLLGYLPETGPLYPEMTVSEFLGFAADLRSLKGPARVAAIDRVVRICHLEGVRHQTLETLSKGFRQRVGLAQAILHDPPALVLDEPTDGLDPNQKREVRQLIASMARDKAIVFSTHILEEVEAICTRVIIIAGGRLVVDESPEALRRRHPHHRGVVLRMSSPASPEFQSGLRALPEVASVQPVSGGLLLLPRNGAPLAPLLLEKSHRHSWPVEAVSPAPTPLDEVFHELTRTQVS